MPNGYYHINNACKVEIAIYFAINLFVPLLCKQNMLYLYAEQNVVLVPEEKSFDWSCITF